MFSCPDQVRPNPVCWKMVSFLKKLDLFKKARPEAQIQTNSGAFGKIQRLFYALYKKIKTKQTKIIDFHRKFG